MSKYVNAVGLKCPMPVMMVKKEMDQGEEVIVVEVDNEIAVENLKKLGANQGYETEIEEELSNYKVTFQRTDTACDTICEAYQGSDQSKSYTIFIGKDYVGEGDKTLGRSLMQMMLYTLLQSESLPESILFMNAGVKIVTEDEQCVEHLKELSSKGVEILVCGTCLNFYGLSEQIKIGNVSNMYDILCKMQQAAKVITV